MSASSFPCPRPEQLREFALGVIAEAEATWIADHLDTCAACEETIDRLDLSGDTLVNALLSPAEADALAAEPGCRRVEALALEIGANLPLRPAESPQAVTASEPFPTQIGPYRIVERIGAGGMGTVYKAVHTRLDRIVALKVLPAERTQNAGAVARFEREMRAIGKLDHPHIVRATDAGEAQGLHYLVMELVDGIDLATIVQRSGPLPISDACEVIRQAALGLEEAHSHGMVHRDIKPSNLMLARSPRRGELPAVKILDLGLALLSNDRSGNQAELTSENQVVGTVDYLPPEQLADTHHVDTRADIYGLGATLYKLLTGDPPFPTSRYPTLLQKLSAIATASIPPVETRRTDIPAGLAVVVAKMLSRDPQQRFAAPQDVVAALQPFTREHHLAQWLAGQQLDGAPGTGITEVLARVDPAVHSGNARRRTCMTRPVLAVAAAVAMCATIIITIKRPNGDQTVIEVPPQVDATITQGTAEEGPRIELRPAATTEKSAAAPSTATDAAAEANRRAVAWALAVGGKVTIIRGEQRFPVTSPLVLPSPGDLLEINLTQLKIVDDSGLENLRGATAIQTLVINSTGVSSLDVVTSLTNLEALNCSIDILDADDLRTLIPLTSLRELAVGIFASQPPSAEATAQAFAAVCRLRQLKKLRFGSFYYPLGDDSLVHLQQMGQLDTLSLGSADLTSEGLLKLPPLPELTWLAIGCPRVRGEGLSRLSDYPKLQFLTLRAGKLTDADFVYVKSPPSLQQLWFHNCSELRGVGLDQLDCLPQLNWLTLNGTPITDEGLATVAKAGVKLQTLGLMNSPNLSNAGLDTLAQLQHVQYLDIARCPQITDEAIPALGRMPALSLLGIAGTGITPDGIAALRKVKPGINLITK